MSWDAIIGAGPVVVANIAADASRQRRLDCINCGAPYEPVCSYCKTGFDPRGTYLCHFKGRAVFSGDAKAVREVDEWLARGIAP